MANYNWPINPTTVNSGPVQFEIDGIPTTVNIDTGTPANSTPLPVRLYDSGGSIVAINSNYGASSGAIRTASQIGNTTGAADFNAGVTGAQTLRVEANQGAANATPWNIAAASLPLPTGAATEATLSTINGKFGTLGQKTMAGSAPVVIASDQSEIPVTANSAINTGSFAQIPNLVNTAQTFTAPANAVGFKIQAPSTNTENISFSVGSVATITAGILMEPGRSEDFDVGSNISVIATSATTQVVTVIWKVRP